jgi:mono/diheme cytochrome c family protein
MMKRMLEVLFLTAVLGAPASVLAADGAALYKKSCASCHGQEGKNGKAAPIAGLPEAVVTRNIKTHPYTMNSFGLSPEEVQAIVTYVAGLKK